MVDDALGVLSFCLSSRSRGGDRGCRNEVPPIETPELSQVFSVIRVVNLVWVRIALFALTAARNAGFLICAFLVRSASFFPTLFHNKVACVIYSESDFYV